MSEESYINHSTHGPQSAEQRAKNIRCLKAARLAYRVRMGKMTVDDVTQRINASNRTAQEKDSALALFQYFLKYDKQNYELRINNETADDETEVKAV
tara:strand:+ start:315 stop:605 length:291 start_codon:yes stop_codon:yes gene_type:complete